MINIFRILLILIFPPFLFEIKLIPCKVYNVFTLIKKSETANGIMEDIKSIKVGGDSIELKIIDADPMSFNIFDNTECIGK